jgi:hypothetical protein
VKQENMMNTAPESERRSFVKRAAYLTPAILTLAATPAFAKAGSVKNLKREKPKKDK